jgi:hypothetical protein
MGALPYTPERRDPAIVFEGLNEGLAIACGYESSNAVV